MTTLTATRATAQSAQHRPGEVAGESDSESELDAPASTLSGSTKPPPIVVCADVGSTKKGDKGNFGWWSSDGNSGSLPSTLARQVAGLLNRGTRVALGFECPLFVPLVDDELLLTNARPGEGSSPWSAGAGCGALATGLVQVAWVLRAVHQQVRPTRVAFLDWADFSSATSGLFLWEAFVSGSAKQGSHINDARAGAQAFLRALADPVGANAVPCKSEVYSLVGATLLRTGWLADLAILREPCLVLRA